MEFKHLKKFNESKIDIFSDYVNDFTDLGFSFKLVEGYGYLITLIYSGKGLDFTHIADLFIELVLRINDKYIINKKSISFEKNDIKIDILFVEDSEKFKVILEGIEYIITLTGYYLNAIENDFWLTLIGVNNEGYSVQISWDTYMNDGLLNIPHIKFNKSREKEFQIDLENSKIIVELIKSDKIIRLYSGDYTKTPKDLKSKEIGEIEKYLTPENLANI